MAPLILEDPATDDAKTNSRNTADRRTITDKATLLQERKLVLLVDLDHTMLHTTSKQFEGDYEEGLFQVDHGRRLFTVMLRPHHDRFLAVMSCYFELHVVSKCMRSYASSLLEHLDPEQRYFGNRVYTREDLPNESKFELMLKLFPDGYEHVVAIDDRRSVWSHMINQYRVSAYRYFTSGYFGLNDVISAKMPDLVDDEQLLEAERFLIDVHERFFSSYDKGTAKSTTELFTEVHEERKMSKQIAKMSVMEENMPDGAKEIPFPEHQGLKCDEADNCDKNKENVNQ
ncbi:hypothetical protein L596_000521 [Steinernema carpocapsae]|uniref:protein-serine/threonine phosphatase n=1 Tax=Steinernema carpocapsae TaxID=34508 RepID=A0A4U8UIN3_STECR|nr:hypothetical protein L596_000521 [Steinernema carpocapsae]